MAPAGDDMRVIQLTELLAARELECQRLRESNRQMLEVLEETIVGDDAAIAELAKLGIPPGSEAYALTNRIKALVAATKALMSQKLPNPPPSSPIAEFAPEHAGSAIPPSIAQQLIGQTVLITVDCWFLAPDGRHYRAVWGTLRGVHTAEATLGIRPNGKSTNWYLEIGNMVIAGCQIHYALRCDRFNAGVAMDHAIDAPTGIRQFERPCLIYNANVEST